MDPTTQRLMEGAAGAAGDPIYVDDVFSTFLYDGNGSTQTITNGIDLNGEGGLVWAKWRSGYYTTRDHFLFDTERGTTPSLSTNLLNGESTAYTDAITYNSNGFTWNQQFPANQNFGTETFASWSFRKAPGFFTIKKFSGSGAAQTIDHDLGTTPGFILVKALDDAQNWAIFHTSLGATSGMSFNTDASSTSPIYWNDTAPTSTQFTVGSLWSASGKNYVAYLFANDAQSFGTDRNEAIIKCGSYTGGGSSDVFVDLGFEPQWVMVKSSSQSSTNWTLADYVRGIPSGYNDASLKPNASDAEQSYDFMRLNATGFTLNNLYSDTNNTGQTYIYVAIRRPNKPPAAATEVFDLQSAASDTSGSLSSSTVFGDLLIDFNNPGTGNIYKYWYSRLSISYLATGIGSEVNTVSFFNGERNFGFLQTSFWGSSAFINYTLRRAPGFMDIVCYTGTGSAVGNTGQQNISHNLQAVPELIIVKGRQFSSDFTVYNATSGPGTNMRLNRDNADISDIYCWDNTTPTSSVFRVGAALGGDTNNNGQLFIAWLFASVDGISKIGSYTGTGAAVDVDCGFTGGARFVMIKRTDVAGQWLYWDTIRGIGTGNEDAYTMDGDPGNAYSGNDWLDPLTAGFTVTATAPNDLNAVGGTFIFIAIA